MPSPRHGPSCHPILFILYHNVNPFSRASSRRDALVSDGAEEIWLRSVTYVSQL